MNRQRMGSLFAGMLVLFLAALVSGAAEKRPPGYDAPAPGTRAVSGTGGASKVSAAPTNAASADVGGIDVTADQLEYLAEQKLLIGRGHVVVTRDNEVLKADYISVRTDTEDCHAKGHVTMTRAGQVWQGEEMKYNFKTEQGDFGQFNAFFDPFYVTSKDSKRTSPHEYVLHNATITTCEGGKPEFMMRAKEAHIIDQIHLRAGGVVFYLFGIPFFYTPAFKADVGGEGLDFDVVPGYSSLMGAFLLTACNYDIADGVKGSTHLDYRTKRGVGVGQDFRWKDTNTNSRGEFKSYYAQDKKPFKDAQEEQERGGQVEQDRYRLRLSDVHNLSERDYAVTELNYLSDKFVLQDFFDREYRYNVQPENRITLTHPGEEYTAGLNVNRRLNDFYDNVNRTPEATLDFSQQEIGDSPFYYQGENRAAFMERVFSEGSKKQDYDAFRVYTEHMVLYPKKYFGFFTIIPRADYRGTYYSKTIETLTQTNVVTSTDSNGVSTVSTNVETTIQNTGSGWRNVYELGFETSFKAFKVLHEEPTGLGHDVGLRHVVEPYTYYTYIPEPNLTPPELPQFDDIDRYDKRNDIKLGVRNKLQTKRGGGVHDLADADLYTTYRFEKNEGQNDFSDIFLDTELRVWDWWNIDFDGSYDPYGSTLKTFNTRMALYASDDSRVSFEYRYQEGTRSLYTTELRLFPNRKWSIDAYVRYEAESGDLEEISGFLTRRTQCMGYGVGAKQVDQNTTFWVQVWLLAFPGSSIELGK